MSKRKWPDGSIRRHQSFRLYIDTEALKRLENLPDTEHPSLSYLINELLEDYLTEKENTKQ
ncbi:hypothetical protein [Pseudomonas cavernicola]|uniref:hypothetical protein n=1 Tax=Pseudomonas cavernicola TaxID=2320866 RepID=UPI0011C3958D|nr:hypothetical protein [Pseudomonas cavernicola]